MLKADKRGRVVDSVTAKAIFKRDGGCCIYCGNPADVIDHVVPVSKGGLTIEGNLVSCCNNCNHAKGAKLDITLVARGLFWLMQKGEDVSWVDKL